MLAFFPTPYPDETMYSIIMRYNRLTGNYSALSTMLELFGLKTHPPLYYTSDLGYLSNQLPLECGYSPEYFFENHTIFKFFEPFQTKERWRKIIAHVKQNETIRFQFPTNIYSNSDIFKYKQLRLCISCAEEDKNKYGEIYYHRKE